MSKTVTTLLILVFIHIGNVSGNGDVLNPSHATMKYQSDAGRYSANVVNLTLTDAVFLGLRNNRSIRSSYYTRLSEKFDLSVSEDQFTPKMVITSRTTTHRNDNDRFQKNQITPYLTLTSEMGTRFSLSWANQLNRSNYAGRARSDDITFNVIQPLLKGAGRDIATAPAKLARLSETVNKLALKSSVSNTVTKIIFAYRDLLQTQEQLRISRNALERSQKLLEVNRAMIDAGRMAQVELVQTEADTAGQELNVEETLNQFDFSRLELLRLLALSSETRINAVDNLDAKPLVLDQSQAVNAALQQQPDYLTQIINGKKAAVNLDVAKNNNLWDVSLVGGASQGRDLYSDHSYQENSRRWEGYAGVQIEIPIGDLNRRQGIVHAQVEVENQEIFYAEVRQALEQSVINAVRDIGTRWRQHQIAQRTLELSRKKLDIEKQKLQVGRSSNFQVLSYEADLRNAESITLNSLITYLNAETQLDQILGTTLDSWDISLND